MSPVVRGNRCEVPIATRVLMSVFLLTAQLPTASQAGTPPTVEFVMAPAPGETVHYRVPFEWEGFDVDGTVPLYRVAIDPPAVGDPFWFETSSTAQTVMIRMQYTARMLRRVAVITAPSFLPESPH